MRSGIASIDKHMQAVPAHLVKTCACVAALLVHVLLVVCLQGAPSQSVPLKTAAKGMSHFVAVPASQSDVVAPNSSSHPTCLALQQFVKRLSQVGTGVVSAAQVTLGTCCP
jgi:hypothetical protein